MPYAGVECPSPERELVALVLAARAGDSSAWTKLLGRFDRTLRSIAGSCRLAPADVDDVVQATWLDLLRDIERVREPAGIAGWLGLGRPSPTSRSSPPPASSQRI